MPSAPPRILGKHPETEEDITASIGRFGPFIVHDGDFRSLKTDDVYEIPLSRALEILAEEKKIRGKKKTTIGKKATKNNRPPHKAQRPEFLP